MSGLNAQKAIGGMVALVIFCMVNSQRSPGAVVEEADPMKRAAWRGISVSGEGRVAGRPDVAILRLGVNTHAATVREAQAQAQQAMEQLLRAIKASGIAERDIQTQQFSLSPEYSPPRPGTDQPPRVTGYRVQNTLSVKIRKIDTTGEVIDAATQAVGNPLQVQGVSFTLDDPTALRSQAREKAMHDAKNKAEQLARLAGLTLGKPIYINEGGMTPVPLAGGERESFAASARTAISPGELEVTVYVEVTYAIADAPR